MPKGYRCTDPTHTFGVRECATCKAARERARTIAKRAARGEVLLVPAGRSVKAAAITQSWQARRAKYGERGASPEADRRQRQLAARRARQRRRTHCLRGHRLTPDNVLVYPTGRMCRTCNRERCRQRRTGRPEWMKTREGVRVNVTVHDVAVLAEGVPLWAAVRAAHPDAGGTARRFVEAKRRWDRFVARETQWYAAVGLAMPDCKRGEAAKEAA